MENNTSINHENGNGTNRLLADSALVCSGCLKNTDLEDEQPF